MKRFYLMIFIMIISFGTYGQTNWTGAFDSDFENPANWTDGVPNDDGELVNILASANDPIVSSPLSINFNLQVFASITFDAAVDNDNLLTTFGGGNVIINAAFNNNAGKFINNNGSITNNGTLINAGTIQSNGSGHLNNSAGASAINNAGAAINNFATINNDGDFINDGGISNCNIINNLGLFINNSSLNQGVNGIFNNEFTFENNGNIGNSGQVNNLASGTFNNNNLLQNNSNGTITNDGLFENFNQINNAGLFTNTGILNNYDFLINDFGATLNNNSGEILNSSCATFRQFTANPINCISGCAFINNGILYQIGANVDITSGTGIVLNDINQQPSPDANCQDIIIVLDDTGTAMIEALDVDDNSTAGYCNIASYSVNINSFSCANTGPNVVVLTVTDDLGNSNFCTATVTVVDGEAPVINDCPLDLTINLDAGECEAIVNFDDPTVMDICGATLIRTDNSGLNSGDAFPIGTTIISYQATDGLNLSNCSFEIVVNEYPDPVTSLTCNAPLLQVVLDDNCEAVIGADDILEGGPYGCYDTYLVELFYDFEMTQPVPTSPLVTSQDIDDTLYVMVTEPIIGNNCWSSIIVKDYLAPEIICEDKTITCLESVSPDVIGYPASFDNCDNGLFPLYTDTISGGGCADEILTRTWTVTDASGNSASCQQTITIVRPDFNLLTFPQNLDDLELPALDCADSPSAHPDDTGWPQINGQDIINTCNFNSTYDDQVIPICEGSTKIIRTWTTYDWCTSTSMSDIQIIKILDQEGPVLTCPQDIQTSTATNSCVASVLLPQPQVFDVCGTTIQTEISSSAGEIYNGVLINLPIGVHTVTYLATDDCGNTSTCEILVTVVDEIPPVAICETAHTVSLTIDEPTLVNAYVFDDGSYDNCSNLIYEVRRMDTPHCPGFDGTAFGTHVPFYCCDLSGVVMVELKITDESGNTNSCMTEVTVQDQLNPAIQCPPNIVLDCNQDYTDLSLTGEAIASDNCDFTLSYNDLGDTDNCGGGTITRVWTATDQSGNSASCVQQITLENASPFYIIDTACNNADPNDGVIWPCDYVANGCNEDTDPAITGEPLVIEGSCDLVGVTHEDIILPITEPACIKIIRVWKIYDWCQYDASTGEGLWTYNQIIKILNTTAPIFVSDCTDQSFCSYEEDCGDAPVTLTVEASDDCTDAQDLNYQYEVDINNNGTTDYSGNTADASGNYPLGTHKIRWYVEDGCGNINSCEYLFVVVDCKNPTPYCINGLAIELMPNSGMVEIWANDFNVGSFDNCMLDQMLIQSPSQGPGQNLPPSSASASWVFDCDDVGTQTVDFWVSDVNGNWDYCSTYILIQDNMFACPDQPNNNVQVSGTLFNESGNALASAMVYLESDAPGIPDPNMTGLSGGYGFPDLPTGYDYTIEPSKNDDPLNGVSTFDLVLMTKHILGAQLLDSPYKLIAADVNASGGISTFDIVLLRRLILQIDDEFTVNNSWRFVAADFVFSEPSNPFATPFPEVLNIQNLDQDHAGDFVAIKIGDLNVNAVTSNLTGESDDRNFETPMVFAAKDKLLNPNRLYQIDFTAEMIEDISGFQFTMNFDQEMLRFVNVVPGTLPNMSLSNFGLTKLQGGALTMSWHQDLDVTSIADDQIIFSLIFEAKQQIFWSEALTMTSKYTRAEAYNKSTEILGAVLRFEEADERRYKFELYPAQPNPFMEETKISFSLPEPTELTLSITDVSGKIVLEKSENANEGYNELIINRQDLNGPGVYFYTLKTKTHRVTDRIVLVRD